MLASVPKPRFFLANSSQITVNRKKARECMFFLFLHRLILVVLGVLCVSFAS